MPILGISRDQGENVNIVRIVTSDSMAAVSATGYIHSQFTNIETVNNGAFTWNPTDEVLVNAGGTEDDDGNSVGGTNAFFMISPDFTSLLATGSQVVDGLTALAGGGQTGATPLTPGFNVVSTVATAADSVQLPAYVSGQSVTVTNTSANSLNVYPALGDTINALSANQPLAVASQATTTFYGVSATNWRSK